MDIEAVIFNPLDQPVEDLPVIYGFSTLNPAGWIVGTVLSQNGVAYGMAVGRDEQDMPMKLGVQVGGLPEIHATLQGTFPDGYRMEYVWYADTATHAGLRAAIDKIS